MKPGAFKLWVTAEFKTCTAPTEYRYLPHMTATTVSSVQLTYLTSAMLYTLLSPDIRVAKKLQFICMGYE
jgi:hypothetical protein